MAGMVMKTQKCFCNLPECSKAAYAKGVWVQTIQSHATGAVVTHLPEGCLIDFGQPVLEVVPWGDLRLASVSVWEMLESDDDLGFV